MKLATDAVFRVYLVGLADPGKMLLRLPYSSVLYLVIADAATLNCFGVSVFTDVLLVALIVEGVFPFSSTIDTVLNSATLVFCLGLSPNSGTNLR